MKLYYISEYEHSLELNYTFGDRVPVNRRLSALILQHIAEIEFGGSERE